MKRTWFAHGHWPAAFVRTHWFALGDFLFLFVTGLLLVLPQVHTALIPVLPLIYDLHITFGILLGLALLLPLVARLPKGRKVRRYDWVLAQVMIASLTMSGIVLWLVIFFPATWRALAFTLHTDFSYIMIGWIALHALLRAFSAGANSALRFVNRRVNWERRGFVKWSALGLFGTWASLALGGVPAPAPKASAAGAAAPDAAKQLPQFAEYYTVTGGYPAISAKDYRLTVDGLVDRPFTLTLEELRALPSTLVVRNFQCVTGWVVPSVEWRGVRLAELAARAGVKREAAFITFYSADGQYTDSLSLVQAGKRDVLLAYEIDGQPLPQQQGYPVRLIVPEMYGYKSVKWVQRLSFVKSREMGYWEVRGYPADAYIGMQGPLI